LEGRSGGRVPDAGENDPAPTPESKSKRDGSERAEEHAASSVKGHQ